MKTTRKAGPRNDEIYISQTEYMGGYIIFFPPKMSTRATSSRCDRNGSPWDRCPQYDRLLSTVMVRVSDIILHKGTPSLNPH
jgi:hypothetical protein